MGVGEVLGEERELPIAQPSDPGAPPVRAVVLVVVERGGASRHLSDDRGERERRVDLVDARGDEVAELVREQDREKRARELARLRESAARETGLRGSRFKAFTRARERFAEMGSCRCPLR